MKFYKIWDQKGCIIGFICYECLYAHDPHDPKKVKYSGITRQIETEENVTCFYCLRCKGYIDDKAMIVAAKYNRLRRLKEILDDEHLRFLE